MVVKATGSGTIVNAGIVFSVFSCLLPFTGNCDGFTANVNAASFMLVMSFLLSAPFIRLLGILGLLVASLSAPSVFPVEPLSELSGSVVLPLSDLSGGGVLPLLVSPGLPVVLSLSRSGLVGLVSSFLGGSAAWLTCKVAWLELTLICCPFCSLVTVSSHQKVYFHAL